MFRASHEMHSFTVLHMKLYAVLCSAESRLCVSCSIQNELDEFGSLHFL